MVATMTERRLVLLPPRPLTQDTLSRASGVDCRRTILIEARPDPNPSRVLRRTAFLHVCPVVRRGEHD